MAQKDQKQVMTGAMGRRPLPERLNSRNECWTIGWIRSSISASSLSSIARDPNSVEDVVKNGAFDSLRGRSGYVNTPDVAT